MASNAAFIAYTNVADPAVSIIASTSQLLTPISNLLVPHVARKWRGAGGTTDNFVYDLGASTTIDTLAVFGITATQIRLRVSSLDVTGSAGDIYDSGTLAVDQIYLSSITILPATVSGRYFRVDLTTTGAYVEAGRVFLGTSTQFAFNYVKGWQRLWNDRSTKSKTRGGQTQIFKDVTYRSIDVTFDFLSQTDRDGFVEVIDRVNATSTDVLFVTNPTSVNLPRDSIWGLISSATPVVQPYDVSFYSKQYLIEERL